MFTIPIFFFVVSDLVLPTATHTWSYFGRWLRKDLGPPKLLVTAIAPIQVASVAFLDVGVSENRLNP